MFFALNAQQRDRQDQLRALLDERMPEPTLRTLMADPAGDDPELWPEVAQRAASYEPEDLGAVLEVLGERLYIGPYLSSVVMAALVYSSAGTTRRRPRSRRAGCGRRWHQRMTRGRKHP